MAVNKRGNSRNTRPFVLKFLYYTVSENLESDRLRVVARANSIASRCYTTPQLPQLVCSAFIHNSSAALSLDHSMLFCDDLGSAFVMHTDVQHWLETDLKIVSTLGILAFCQSFSVFPCFSVLCVCKVKNKIGWATQKWFSTRDCFCFCNSLLCTLPSCWLCCFGSPMLSLLLPGKRFCCCPTVFPPHHPHKCLGMTSRWVLLHMESCLLSVWKRMHLCLHPKGRETNSASFTRKTVFYLRYAVSENINPGATVISCIRPKFVPAWAIHLKWPFEVSPVLIISYKILQFFLAFLEMKDRNLRLTQRRRPTLRNTKKLHRLNFSIPLPNCEVKKMESLPIPPSFLFKGLLGRNLEVLRCIAFAFCIELKPFHLSIYLLTSGSPDGQLRLLSSRVQLLCAGHWPSFTCWVPCNKNPSHV